jgi:hypothetical protein
MRRHKFAWLTLLVVGLVSASSSAIRGQVNTTKPVGGGGGPAGLGGKGAKITIEYFQ